jgi:hypothetical protein
MDPYGKGQECQSHFRSARGILGSSQNVVEDIDQPERASYRRSKSIEIKPQDMRLHYSARQRRLQVGSFRRFSRTERVGPEQVQASRLEKHEFPKQHPAWAGTCVIVFQMTDSTRQQFHGWVTSNTVDTMNRARHQERGRLARQNTRGDGKSMNSRSCCASKTLQQEAHYGDHLPARSEYTSRGRACAMSTSRIRWARAESS